MPTYSAIRQDLGRVAGSDGSIIPPTQEQVDEAILANPSILTREQLDAMLVAGAGTTDTIEEGSTLPIQSGAVYEAVDELASRFRVPDPVMLTEPASVSLVSNTRLLYVVTASGNTLTATLPAVATDGDTIRLDIVSDCPTTATVDLVVTVPEGAPHPYLSGVENDYRHACRMDAEYINGVWHVKMTGYTYLAQEQ